MYTFASYTMNEHFLCQLTNAVRMTNNKQYLKQLERINKLHSFIVLRALYGTHCETEMHRVNCGRIEILDGSAFLMRKTYNTHTKTKTRQYTSSCLRESSGTSPKVPKSSQPLSFLCSKSPELIQTFSPSVNLGVNFFGVSIMSQNSLLDNYFRQNQHKK